MDGSLITKINRFDSAQNFIQFVLLFFDFFSLVTTMSLLVVSGPKIFNFCAPYFQLIQNIFYLLFS